MYSVDKTNFKSYLKKFPDQILESQKLVNGKLNKIKFEKIQNVVYLGMGGSAISGDLINDAFFDLLRIPLQVIRGYEPPVYCNENSLVIAVSYSGNTEEVISAVKKAHLNKSQIVAVTSGGTLLEMVEKNGWSYIKVPAGFPPRQAFGYLFFTVLYIMNVLFTKPVKNKEIENVIQLVNSIMIRNDDEMSSGKILAKDLAMKIHSKIPIIYSCSPYTNTLSTRWRTQFHENAKSLAFSNAIPEMNHNEIVGWEMKHRIINNFVVIFLENHTCGMRIKTRIQLTKNIIRDRGVEVIEIYSEGKGIIQNLISLVCLGDWVTYYLALLYEKDPASILNIDFFKAQLISELAV
jgi:glucose/mannose-6-phosphate isomerase